MAASPITAIVLHQYVDLKYRRTTVLFVLEERTSAAPEKGKNPHVPINYFLLSSLANHIIITQTDFAAILLMVSQTIVKSS
jgi:hypothetical protein